MASIVNNVTITVAESNGRMPLTFFFSLFFFCKKDHIVNRSRNVIIASDVARTYLKNKLGFGI